MFRSATLHVARTASIQKALISIALLGLVPVSAQVIATYDFEDGTAQGWTSFNGATAPANTTAAAQNGTHSLLTTTGGGGAGGPGITLTNTLQPGATYTITGYIRLTSGETATNANFTMRSVDGSGTNYNYIGSFTTAVNASGWAQIGGSYTVTASTTSLLLYAQLIGASTAQSFYLDNVVITETAPPPSGPTAASYTFEDGGTDGWFGFGSPAPVNAMPPVTDPNGGTHSLLSTGRTAAFMGPAVNLVSKLTAGATYQITAYVLLAAPDASNPTVTMTVQRTDCAGQTYANVGSATAISSSAWTKVQGTYSFTNIPGPPSGLILYIQSSSATDSYYVDDVTVMQIAAPPPDPSLQDNTGITTNFDDGATDGWSGRGSATVQNSTVTAHSGSNSLLVTGRTANWNGPQISVNNKMYNGSQYSVSLWIKLLPTDGSNHTMNISLQTTLSGNTSFPSVTAYPGVVVNADGNWHQISVPLYNMSNAYDSGQASLYVQTVPASGNDLVSFYIDDFQLTYLAPPTPQTGIPSIYQTLSYYFPVGAEIDTSDLSGPHAQLLTQQFNSIVSGNDMKWSVIEPTKGSLQSTNADQEVGFAVCNNLKVRGHNLLWATGAQTPSYAYGDGTNSPANQATVIANIQEHIKSEVQHFGNKVYIWDVINEPIDPNQPDCLYHGPFYNVLGESYLDVALRAARQYAPAGTKLFINDYRTNDTNGLACMVQVVQRLQSRGVPLDGVGHEAHLSINYPPVSNLVNAVNAISNLGLDNQITEMDMSVYNGGDNTSNYGANGGTIPPSIIAQQGYKYMQFFDAFRNLKGKISGVTLWGLADDNTWLSGFPIARLDAPLPFDTKLQPKPAYWGIVDPTQLPGWGLQFTVTAKTGAQNARVWTVTAKNPSSGTAYTTQINGFTLTQVAGAACTPVVTPPSSYPIMLGDIAGGGSASANFTIDFTGCAALARFTLTMPWSSARGADTGTLVSGNQFR